MAHQTKSSNVFDLLREYDVELSPQVHLILETFKFNSVRTTVPTESLWKCERTLSAKTAFLHKAT